jgi:putative restriction endonuclease
MADPVLGPIPSVDVGATFPNRAALAQAGVHRQVEAGITYAPGQAAESVVLSGGYADDRASTTDVPWA